MDWLTQNWVWIALAIGAAWLFGRRGLAGFRMGGHTGDGGGTGPAPGGAPNDGNPMRNQGQLEGAPPEKAVDPVSGHEVLIAHALTSVYQGRVLYFESPENRQRFEATPDQYARGAAPETQQQRHHGGCC